MRFAFTAGARHASFGVSTYRVYVNLCLLGITGALKSLNYDLALFHYVKLKYFS